MLDVGSERSSGGTSSAGQGNDSDFAEGDADQWLPEALADVIEQQSRRNVAKSVSLSLDLSAMAKRAGVTPRAVRQALEAAPLEKRQIAMSLSDTAEGDLPEGCTADQIVDTTLYLARTLISAGASLAYGGDFRGKGFTVLLAELIRSYNLGFGGATGE